MSDNYEPNQLPEDLVRVLDQIELRDPSILHFSGGARQDNFDPETWNDFLNKKGPFEDKFSRLFS